LKEEIDLLEVPLFEVISAYLEDMETAGVVDYWDEMTEFLLLMSLLVEIKSRLLLPGGQAALEEEMTPEEARDRLLARLFEYSKFKAAGCRPAQGVGRVERRLRLPAARGGGRPPAGAARRDSGDRRRHGVARRHLPSARGQG